MKNLFIGLGICIGLYSTFYYLHCKNNKKTESKNDEEINNDEEKINDKSTQTENLIKKDKGIIKEVLDDIIINVENQDKKNKVCFDEGFEVIQ